MTCDSDGEMSVFYARDGAPPADSSGGLREGIPVPDAESLQGEYLAILLTGAYQDSTLVGQNMIPPVPEMVVTINKEGIKYQHEEGLQWSILT